MRYHRRLFQRGFTFNELLVVLAIVFATLALLAPGLVESRAASRTLICKNNLRQIGIALHNYHETHLTFPNGWVARHTEPRRVYGYGWGAQLLPFVEYGNVYNQLNFNVDMPAANTLLQTNIEVYRCPVDPTPASNPLRSNYGTSNYSGNAGTTSGGFNGKQTSLTHWLSPRRTRFWPGAIPVPSASNGIFWRNSSTRIRDIRDGTSNTLCVGERGSNSGAGIWAGVARNDFIYDVVTDCGPGNEINKRFTSFSSNHAGGAHFVLCDGSTRFISESINSNVFQALATRNGREKIPDF